MSTRVVPGTKYYWRDFAVDGLSAPERHDALVSWLDINVSKRYYRENDFAGAIAFIFEDEDDAVAFKLKFGL